MTTITHNIGHTPLIRLRSLEPRPGVEIWAKAEWMNPSGSVKDRAISAIIRDGIRTGALCRGKTIIDSSSGNAGISYAMIGAARGYPVTIYLPASASEERKRIIRAYGAALIETSRNGGSDGAYTALQEVIAVNPRLYFYGNQYGNDANWRAHHETTGPEIWNQTGGRVTHVVAGIGTGGTLRGIAAYLREQNPAITTVGVVPCTASDRLPGLRHLETAMTPEIYDPAAVDVEIGVTATEARAMTRTVACSEGIYPGPSGGAALVAAERVAYGLEHGVVVTVIPDSGERYLSL